MTSCSLTKYLLHTAPFFFFLPHLTRSSRLRSNRQWLEPAVAICCCNFFHHLKTPPSKQNAIRVGIRNEDLHLSPLCSEALPLVARSIPFLRHSPEEFPGDKNFQRTFFVLRFQRLSTSTTFPKTCFVHPFTCPWLLEICSPRFSSFAVTRCVISPPRTRQ